MERRALHGCSAEAGIQCSDEAGDTMLCRLAAQGWATRARARALATYTRARARARALVGTPKAGLIRDDSRRDGSNGCRGGRLHGRSIACALLERLLRRHTT